MLDIIPYVCVTVKATVLLFKPRVGTDMGARAAATRRMRKPCGCPARCACRGHWTARRPLRHRNETSAWARPWARALHAQSRAPRALTPQPPLRRVPLVAQSGG